MDLPRRIARGQAQQGHAKRGLARSRFANDAQGLATSEAQVDIAHRIEGLAPEPARLEPEPTADALTSQQLGGVSGDRRQGAPRPAVDQAAGVGVDGRLEELLGRRDLDQFAGAHHTDPIGETAYQRQVMADQEHRHADAPLKVVEQLDDLALDGHVERGRGLIGHQQRRLTGERHRNHRALALPARELVRIAVNAPLRLGHTSEFEQLDRTRARRNPARALMQHQGFTDLVAD